MSATPLAGNDFERELLDELQKFGNGAPAQTNGKRRAKADAKAQGSNDDGPGLTKMLADAISLQTLFARDLGGRLYRHVDGVYRPDGEAFVRTRVKHLLEKWEATKAWTKHLSSEVFEFIRVDALYLWDEPPVDEVNVLNGILNLETRCLRPHDPGFLSAVQIPVTFDPAATCPTFDKFVSETFPADAQQIAYEVPAALIRPATRQKTVILLIGAGNNGKSVYLAALIAFLGRRNIAGLSLHRLEDDRFSTARLVGKLANICADLPSTALESVSMFKAITGRDIIPAEYKYLDSFEFVPFCRLVFSANSFPRSSDNTPAFFDRWLPVPFLRSFEGEEQIPREILEASLTTTNELSGLLNRALDVLPGLLKRGYTDSESIQRARDEFHSTTDPLAIWLDHNTIEAPDAVAVKNSLIWAYNQDCIKNGRPTTTKTGFGVAFHRLRPNVQEGQRTIGTKRGVWCWLGIGQLAAPSDDPTDHRHTDHEVHAVLPIVTSSYRREDGGLNREEEKINNKQNCVNLVTRVTSNGHPVNLDTLTDEEYDALIAADIARYGYFRPERSYATSGAEGMH